MVPNFPKGHDRQVLGLAGHVRALVFKSCYETIPCLVAYAAATCATSSTCAVATGRPRMNTPRKDSFLVLN